LGVQASLAQLAEQLICNQEKQCAFEGRKHCMKRTFKDLRKIHV
jgi:hypothetical protein